MKKIIALVLVTLIAGTSFANKPRKSSRQEMGINGNALYVIEYTYNLHGGQNGGRQLICIDSITFDKRGNFQDKYRTKDGVYYGVLSYIIATDSKQFNSTKYTDIIKDWNENVSLYSRYPQNLDNEGQPSRRNQLMF